MIFRTTSALSPHNNSLPPLGQLALTCSVLGHLVKEFLEYRKFVDRHSTSQGAESKSKAYSDSISQRHVEPHDKWNGI